LNLFNSLSLSFGSSILIMAIFSLLLFFLYLYKFKRIHSQLNEQQEIFSLYTSITDHPIIIFSEENTLLYSNDAFEKAFQVKATTDDPPMFRTHYTWESAIELSSLHDKAPNNGLLSFTNVQMKIADKIEDIDIEIKKHPLTKKGESSIIGIAIHKRASKTEVPTQHYTNTLSGLPNYNQAIADIGILTGKTSVSKQKFIVAIMSIDTPLKITTLIGYDHLQEIIIYLARYLESIKEENNFSVYHMNNNHFILLLPEVDSDRKGVDLIEKHKTDCENLLHHKETHIQFTISTGIAIYPYNKSHLIDVAYTALLTSKDQGVGYTTVAKPDRMINTPEKAPIEYSDIKYALEADQFTVYYQPIFDLEKNVLAGAEALIRWIHPEKGLIPPGLFLPIVEKTGFMKLLSEFVASKIIQQLSTWKKLGFRKIQVAINLSMREFESEDYYLLLKDLLQKHQISASQLKVEITENVAMFNEEYSLSQFKKLEELGIQISLDDFGTGYSSFSMLEAFPINTLKLDRSFVYDMTQNADHYNIVKAMIAMAHSLNIKVIAEGIEDQETANALKLLHADYVQGYYFGKPMPIFEFQELIRQKKQESSSGEVILLDNEL